MDLGKRSWQQKTCVLASVNLMLKGGIMKTKILVYLAAMVLGMIMTFVPLSFVTSGSVALAQNNILPVDHFWCYEQIGYVPALDITLRDHFYAADIKTYVGFSFRFCNPVDKHFQGKSTPITNPYSHLKMYVVRPLSVETRTVVVSNQFGTHHLQVHRPVVLAVPTQKNTLPPSKDLDHFLCYEADGPSPRNGRVTLHDQFRTEDVKVLNPYLFCNAAEEIDAAGNVVPGTEILHPGTHLLCYMTTKAPFVGIVLVNNRFEVNEGTSVGDADMLCVPSQLL